MSPVEGTQPSTWTSARSACSSITRFDCPNERPAMKAGTAELGISTAETERSSLRQIEIDTGAYRAETSMAENVSMCLLRIGLKSIDPRLAGSEAEPLIQPVGGRPVRAGREIKRASPLLSGSLSRPRASRSGRFSLTKEPCKSRFCRNRRCPNHLETASPDRKTVPAVTGRMPISCGPMSTGGWVASQNRPRFRRWCFFSRVATTTYTTCRRNAQPSWGRCCSGRSKRSHRWAVSRECT
jgi:hypothetical protein